jgi:hypothetical protein
MTVSIAGYPLRIRRQVAFGEPDWSVELHSNYVRAIHCARSSIMQAPVAPACQCGSKMVCSCTLHVAQLSYRLGRRAQSTLNGPIPNNGHYLLVPLQRGIRLFFLSSHADRMLTDTSHVSCTLLEVPAVHSHESGMHRGLTWKPSPKTNVLQKLDFDPDFSISNVAHRRCTGLMSGTVIAATSLPHYTQPALRDKGPITQQTPSVDE